MMQTFQNRMNTVDNVKDWLAFHNRTFVWLANETGLDVRTVGSVLGCKVVDDSTLEAIRCVMGLRVVGQLQVEPERFNRNMEAGTLASMTVLDYPEPPAPDERFLRGVLVALALTTLFTVLFCMSCIAIRDNRETQRARAAAMSVAPIIPSELSTTALPTAIEPERIER